MYAMTLDETESILELTVDNNLNEEELRDLLRDLKHTRRRIKNNYKLLIILPTELRNGNIDENEKIDLSVYMAKLKGLKQVVLQTPEKNSSAVLRLKQIYSELAIRVSVTHSFLESQKRLGLLK